MQITIVEAEIKQAISDYIQRHLKVNEGMDIDIDLRATRGETGMQAIIDIVPGKKTATRATRNSTTSVSSTTSASTGAKGNVDAVETAAEEPVVEETAEDKGPQESQLTIQSGSEERAETTASVTRDIAVDAEGYPEKPSSAKSLFANLTSN